MLRDLALLRAIGLPVLLGASRKSTLGRILDLPPDERIEATLATTVLAVAAGVDIVRVHDVRPNVRAARLGDAVARGWRPADWDAGPGEARRQANGSYR
jgi:dihydropteroate synthase